ncbi:putative uncharacterized protein DDB_G0282133 isoform X4 [Agrilus planipennis]|nr:putative uncharacterized protein DDB_G0282133 isoform X3 [Agrilus planipennis]XP_025833385.1 putative uncharacterized protein DDB_G0282133 isoform X4 [Agrilus planipennis]
MPMKANKNYFETTKIEQRLTTNQLPKGQDSVNVLDDTDSVICLGILDVASSKISTNKTSEKYDQNSSLVLSNSNNLNENDVIIVQQYCNLCGEDLNMEYNQISDKHRCPDSARNCQKRTKLTKSICSIETKKTSKIRNSGQDNTTTTTTSGLSSITSLPLNIESCNKNNENPVVIQDTTCNTSTNSLFFNDNNIINALKRKVSEFLDKKYTQTGDATSTSYGNNNKCLCQNFVNLNLKKTNDVESRHKLRVNSESTEVVDDKFEQGCIDNARDNYIFGYNYYGSKVRKKSGLRLIVIDGSNVALGHSKGKFFSSEGLKICIEYFYQRGHEVKAFVPQFRLKNGQTSNKQLLQWLYNRGWVIFTPSREVNGRMIVPYDDRFIVQCAALHDAVIVSNDCYRDLMKENPQWKKTIENNLLMVTWVDDVIYFPTDPLGKRGPRLESFLRYS